MTNPQQLLQYFLYIDHYLISFVSTYGSLSYAALFLIIFCETGLVILPFLPGDALLFAVGSLAANSKAMLHVQLLFVLLTLASILGNKINYLIGRYLSSWLFSVSPSWLLNRHYAEKAHAFYEKHGGKTIIFARFIPVIRTFAPFVAGIAKMSLSQFSFYNILSAVIWVGCLLGAGYFFGAFPFVQKNFSLIVYGIVVISLLPPLCTFIYQKLFRKTEVNRFKM